MSGRAIYPADLANAHRDQAGESYRPANGFEGDIFDHAWCDQCQKDAAYREDENKDGCPIIAYAMGFSIGDAEYPKEWVYDEKGQPKCTAFQEIRQAVHSATLPRCKSTLDLFGGA